MRIFKIIQKLSLFGGIIAGACILLITGLILLEILARSSTGISILIAEEYSAYLLVVFGSMALAYTLKSDGHIRVDLILSKLSSRNKSIVNLICSTIGFIVFVYISFENWRLFFGSWLIKETSMHYSKTLLYLPQFPLFLGSILMALQFLSMFVDYLQNLIKAKGRVIEKERG